jgi:HipA-like protein
MEKKQLSIRLYGEQVGILEQTPSGSKTFSYDSNARLPISIGMPLREEPYGEQQCE